MSLISKIITGSGSSDVRRSIDFDDFSMMSENDAYTTYEQTALRQTQSIQSPPTHDVANMDRRRSFSSVPRSLRTDNSRDRMWGSFYGRQHASAMKGRSFYDVIDKETAPSNFDYLLKAEQMRRVQFAALDENGDGFLTLDEVRNAIGRSEDAERLIKIADKNGDGKIDYKEFCDLIQRD